MDSDRKDGWIALNRIVNALLAGAAAVALASAAWGLDVADRVPQWTAEGKRLATERAAQPGSDHMVMVPAGWFSMGSAKKVDRNAYPAEMPQRQIYVDASRSTPMK